MFVFRRVKMCSARVMRSQTCLLWVLALFVLAMLPHCLGAPAKKKSTFIDDNVVSKTFLIGGYVYVIFKFVQTTVNTDRYNYKMFRVVKHQLNC